MTLVHIYEYPRLAYPHCDFTFKVVFFHAKFADLSLTFPNLRGKYNNGAFVEFKKKKNLKKNFFFEFFFLNI